jgi:hypothetical protein
VCRISAATWCSSMLSRSTLRIPSAVPSLYCWMRGAPKARSVGSSRSPLPGTPTVRGGDLADLQGGYPSGCMLIDGGSGPKSVSGSSQRELGTRREWQRTRGFRLVQASGE